MGSSSTPSPQYPVAQQVRFWMTSPAITVRADAHVSEALAVMHEHSIRRVPVVDDSGRLCGIITEGDIRGANLMRKAGMDMSTIADSLSHTTVFDVMTEQPFFVGPNTSLREAALLMLDNKIGGLPVVDDTQTIVGVITESDLFEALVLYLDRSGSDA
jgi:acetoin utilization protein AcuB/CBS domain-containing protein